MMSKSTKKSTKVTRKLAGMVAAGMLALAMGVSAVAPCVALAQEAPAQAQEQIDKYITPDDAIQIVFNHAYDNWDITPDRMLDLKVKDDSDVKGKLVNYYVTFDIVNRGERRQTYIYYIRASDGLIWGYGVGDAIN